jgi:hypothetical protein
LILKIVHIGTVFTILGIQNNQYSVNVNQDGLVDIVIFLIIVPVQHGRRCLLHDQMCQLNSTCLYGGQRIPIDKYVISNKKFACMCPKDFYDKICEIPRTRMILELEEDIVLPESISIHFIEVKHNAPPENGTTFKIIPIYRNPISYCFDRIYTSEILFYCCTKCL